MKAIVSKTDLRDAIARIMPAVAVKPATPVLAGIYLQADAHSSLTLRATNFELDITAKIPANVEAEGKVVAAGKVFSSIVSKLGGEIITLVDADNQLAIRSEAASFDILTMDAGDFPAPLKIDDEISFNMNKNALKNLIRRTTFAVGKDTTRPIFLGVNFAIEGTQLTAVGTNASRIAIVKDKIYDERSANVIIPAASLRALQSALDVEDNIAVALNKHHAAFKFDNIRFVTRLIDGTFPPFKSVIPATCATTAEVDTKDLLAAIDRIQIISAEDHDKTVMMKFTGDGLELSASSHSVGKAIEHVDADVTGSDLALGMNYQFLIDGLKIFDSQKIQIGMNEKLTPVMFTGKDDPDFIYIATPLRTRA